MDSPVSNNGRGLKHIKLARDDAADEDSPVSNNGRGLKLVQTESVLGGQVIRPLAITGVD